MTDIYTPSSVSESDSQSTTETAKQQARDVSHTAAEAGSAVAGTAKEETRRVAEETTRQARNLYHASREELRSQAGAQQQRAVGGIRTLGGELRSMADSAEQAGPASDYARQAATKIDDVANWLEAREPGALVTEVKEYARRHPGTFLVGAAVLGLIAGRVTRSLAAEISDSHDTGTGTTTPVAPVTPAYVPAPPVATGTATVPVTPVTAVPLSVTDPDPIAYPAPGTAVEDPYYSRGEVRP